MENDNTFNRVSHYRYEQIVRTAPGGHSTYKHVYADNNAGRKITGSSH